MTPEQLHQEDEELWRIMGVLCFEDQDRLTDILMRRMMTSYKEGYTRGLAKLEIIGGHHGQQD